MNSAYLEIMQADVGRCLLWSVEERPTYWHSRMMVWVRFALDEWMLENCNAES